jgi:hypothetical protein
MLTTARLKSASTFFRTISSELASAQTNKQGYQFFASFLMALFLKLSLFQLALKGDSEKITVTFR